MKSTKLVSLSLLSVLIAVLLLATGPARASAEEQVEQATAVSKAWIAQIDAGKYEASYSFGCDAMREKVPQDHWVEVLKAIRGQMGAVTSRQQISHIYKPNGYEGLNGECVVITYDTSFSHLDPAEEVIVLKWEDGQWRGAGYNARPKDPGDGSTSAPAPTTEVQTQAHLKPKQH